MMTTWFIRELSYMAHVGQMEDILSLHTFCKNALSHMHLTLLGKRSRSKSELIKERRCYSYWGGYINFITMGEEQQSQTWRWHTSYLRRH